MTLTAVDWAIIAAYFAVSLGVGVLCSKRAGSSLAEYFVSGRALPWWLAGTSMVATTFAADTPLAVTGLVAKDGLAGNWFWWAFALGGMVTVFVFARLWRRAEVLTDVELIELRYAGRAAAFLRGFRALWVSLLMNSIIIGWVTGAMVTVLRQTVLVDLPQDAATEWLLIAAMLAVVGVYSTLSGMWGVALTDFVQFALAMAGCIALAVVAVNHVGGTAALEQKLIAQLGSDQALRFLPDFSAAGGWMPGGAVLMLLLVQWWATWYPGNEPGGGGYIMQRMAACKDERHALLATLWFQFAHYCLRPWPWILVAFAALVLFPEVRTWATDDDPATDAGAAYPLVMRALLPPGLAGLLLVAFFAAFMSTISTHLNWGALYLVNDVYRRFVRPQAGQRAQARAARLASVLVLALGAATAYALRDTSVEDAWKLLTALGAGTGAVFLLRWFWWRISAWSEIAAMVGSLAFWALLQQLVTAEQMRQEYQMALVAAATIATWLLVTFLLPGERDDVLLAFYRKVRPGGPGWGRIARLAPEVQTDRHLGLSLLLAVLSASAVYLTLPGLGALIFGHFGRAAACLGGAVACGVLVVCWLPRVLR